MHMVAMDRQTQQRMLMTSLGCYILAVIGAVVLCREELRPAVFGTVAVWFHTPSWSWLIVRTIYSLAIWCGLRLILQAQDRTDWKVLLVGGWSILALLIGVAGMVFLPRIAD